PPALGPPAHALGSSPHLLRDPTQSRVASRHCTRCARPAFANALEREGLTRCEAVTRSLRRNVAPSGTGKAVTTHRSPGFAPRPPRGGSGAVHHGRSSLWRNPMQVSRLRPLRVAALIAGLVALAGCSSLPTAPSAPGQDPTVVRSGGAQPGSSANRDPVSS